LLTPKEKAYKVVEERFPDGLHFLEETMEIGNFIISPFPDKIFSKWKRFASLLLAPADKPLLTPLGKRVGESECLRVARKIINDYSNEDLVKIELTSLKEWEEERKAGIPRAYFDPKMWMARTVVESREFHPPALKPFPKRSIPKSFPVGSIIHVHIQNPQANTGFWRFARWNDSRRSDKENEEYHQLIIADSIRWEESISNLKQITPASVAAVSPPTCGFARFQSHGRKIEAPSTKIARQGQRYIQPVQRAIERMRGGWYASGDRLARHAQMLGVLNGSPGTSSCDGDDFIVMTGDGVLSGDSSGFDGGVTDLELNLWLNEFRKSLPSPAWNKYLATFLATYDVDLAGNIGMFKRKERWAIRSGGAETHLAGSYIQDNRIQNADWSTLESGLAYLNQRGVYRPEKQFVFDKTATMAQLVVSSLDEGKKIYGLVSRMARNIRESESWVTQADFLPVDLDARVLANCANLYGGEGWKPWVEFVRSRWTIRSSRRELMERANSLLSKGRSEVRTGYYERESLRSTLIELAK
jgi:hypothetical protein